MRASCSTCSRLGTVWRLVLQEPVGAGEQLFPAAGRLLGHLGPLFRVRIERDVDRVALDRAAQGPDLGRLDHLHPCIGRGVLGRGDTLVEPQRRGDRAGERGGEAGQRHEQLGSKLHG